MRTVSRRWRRVTAALLVVCALTAGTVVAEDREAPRSHRAVRSVIEEILLWALDGLSFPPG